MFVITGAITSAAHRLQNDFLFEDFSFTYWVPVDWMLMRVWVMELVSWLSVFVALPQSSKPTLDTWQLSTSVPLGMSFPRLLFSASLWSNTIWHIKGLMLWQPFDCDIGSVKLVQIRQEKKMPKLRNLVVIFNQTYMFLKASLVLCSVDSVCWTNVLPYTCLLRPVINYWMWAGRVRIPTFQKEGTQYDSCLFINCHWTAKRTQ